MAQQAEYHYLRGSLSSDISCKVDALQPVSVEENTDLTAGQPPGERLDGQSPDFRQNQQRSQPRQTPDRIPSACGAGPDQKSDTLVAFVVLLTALAATVYNTFFFTRRRTRRRGNSDRFTVAWNAWEMRENIY